jgi:hypothetical protein
VTVSLRYDIVECIVNHSCAAYSSRFQHRYELNFVFQNNANHGVLAILYYQKPVLSNVGRVLSSKIDEDKFDYRKDYADFLKDPHGRSLLTSGGSNPRTTLLLDRVQFLNNSLTSDIVFRSFVFNGPFNINTQFADVTMKACFFNGNNYPFTREFPVSHYIGVDIHTLNTTSLIRFLHCCCNQIVRWWLCH